MVIKWENLVRPLHIGSTLCLSFFEYKDALFLQAQGRHLSQDGLMTCFRAKEGREGQKVFSPLSLLRIPSAQKLQYTKVPYCGVACPKSVRCHTFSLYVDLLLYMVHLEFYTRIICSYVSKNVVFGTLQSLFHVLICYTIFPEFNALIQLTSTK